MTADPQQDVLRTCSYCGTQLAPDTMYPIVADSTAAGDPGLRSFCDEACLAGWEADG